MAETVRTLRPTSRWGRRTTFAACASSRATAQGTTPAMAVRCFRTWVSAKRVAAEPTTAISMSGGRRAPASTVSTRRYATRTISYLASTSIPWTRITATLHTMHRCICATVMRVSWATVFATATATTRRASTTSAIARQPRRLRPSFVAQRKAHRLPRHQAAPGPWSPTCASSRTALQGALAPGTWWRRTLSPESGTTRRRQAVSSPAPRWCCSCS